MKTHEFLALHRYNAVNHYHLSDSPLEEALFWNPYAAIWSSQRQNLSAQRGARGRQGGRQLEHVGRNAEKNWKREAGRAKTLGLRGCTCLLAGSQVTHPAFNCPCAEAEPIQNHWLYISDRSSGTLCTSDTICFLPFSFKRKWVEVSEHVCLQAWQPEQW